MEKIIDDLKGKKIDVNCGDGTAFRGENEGVTDGALILSDEIGKKFYIAIPTIIAICEVGDSSGKPGFIG